MPRYKFEVRMSCTALVDAESEEWARERLDSAIGVSHLAIDENATAHEDVEFSDLGADAQQAEVLEVKPL